MFFSLKDKARRARFRTQVKGLVKTAPIRLDASLGLTVLTQLQHKDVLLYLAAIKSFARQVPVEQVHVLDDGSLTQDDRAMLRAHVPGLEVSSIDTHRDPALPSGGTWERLTRITQLAQAGYVIQLDADTLTLGPVPEVIEAVATGRSFTIGTWDRQELESMAGWAAEARVLQKGGAGAHVQVLAEVAFDRLRDAGRLRYVRGCSGFAGFAPCADRFEFMRELSQEIAEIVGEVWRTWGSEQVMSNILVANSVGAMVLPHPAYCDCTKINASQTRFVHFIGSCRFSDGTYAEMINRLEL